jgi:hypothetical protein
MSELVAILRVVMLSERYTDRDSMEEPSPNCRSSASCSHADLSYRTDTAVRISQSDLHTMLIRSYIVKKMSRTSISDSKLYQAAPPDFANSANATSSARSFASCSSSWLMMLMIRSCGVSPKSFE